MTARQVLRRSTGMYGKLTPREIEVLQLIARGCSNKEIAGALYLSRYTVRGYVTTILNKLNLGSRTEAAVKYRLALGILDGAGGDP